MEDDIEEYMSAGADKVLPKPVQIELIYRILSEIHLNCYISKKALSNVNN